MVKTGFKWSKLVKTGQKYNLTEKSVKTPRTEKKISQNCNFEAKYGINYYLHQQSNVKVN